MDAVHSPILRAGHEDWRRERRGGAARRAVLDCVACATLIHIFVSIASRATVRRYAWLDKYIAMRLFQSLDASPLAPREYSRWRMSHGQAVTHSLYLMGSQDNSSIPPIDNKQWSSLKLRKAKTVMEHIQFNQNELKQC
jgi:hypothetical protein